jgi:hypothetical protein
MILRGKTEELGENISQLHFVHHKSHSWNDSDRGKLKYSEINLSECHCVHHKSHWWNDCDGETQILGEEPVTVPFYPPKIPHRLAWHQIQSSKA